MQWKDAVDRARVRLATARERAAIERRELIAAEDRSVYASEALTIIQDIAAGLQRQAHDRIAGVVSRCLAAVFPEPYEFAIDFERKGKRTEARLSFVRGSADVDPTSAAGGGVVDVAAFALRLASVLQSRPAKRRAIILDEPFKFVSADRQEAVRILLETLADELNVQFVIVTHIEALKTGTVIEI